MARESSSAGWPSQCQGSVNLVSAFDSTGSCSRALCQLAPPSVETSTRLTLPFPVQANPRISYCPGRSSGFSGQGKVMTDLASISQVKPREVPSGIRSVYFDVSSREYHARSPRFILPTHLLLPLPSQPGTTSRSG